MSEVPILYEAEYLKIMTEKGMPYSTPLEWKKYRRQRLKEKQPEVYKALLVYEKEYRCKTLLKLKAKAFKILGDKCVRCGFSDPRALQIDHIDGGGNREIKKIGTYRIYYKILKGQTSEYQLLCANCNWIKRVENKETRNSGMVLSGQKPRGHPRRKITSPRKTLMEFIEPC